MNTVRVVAMVPCERCKGAGRFPAVLVGVLIAGAMEFCPDCEGWGTVEREVRCDGCNGWNEGHYCVRWDAFNVPPDHACKAWEPRE